MDSATVGSTPKPSRQLSGNGAFTSRVMISVLLSPMPATNWKDPLPDAFVKEPVGGGSALGWWVGIGWLSDVAFLSMLVF